MREADRRAIEDLGVPSIVLMENAGRDVVAAMAEAFDGLAGAGVTILAGRGNNGGDGFVVARGLAERGADVLVVLVGTRADVRGDARINLDIADRLGLPIVEVPSDREWETHAGAALSRDIIVDALFGTGLSSPLGGIHELIVTAVNESGLPIVSIDLPSGLSADCSAPIGPHIVASMTVTLGALKRPLVSEPAASAAGTVVVADIGIPARVFEALDPPRVFLLEKTVVQRLVPVRRPDAHKGTFGHVLVVAGSRGKTGAAHLAATGALRSGAGLVTVATPQSCVPVVAALGSEFMTVPLAEHDGVLAASALRPVLEFPCDVIAAGPGIGTGIDAQEFVERLVQQSTVPLVLDADALSVLAGHLDALRGSAERPVIVTPHPGELARLTGTPVAAVQEDRIEAARRLATGQGIFVILKGHGTVVAAPDGNAWINSTGNPGMATGGSGDVLTGMVAAWLAQTRDARDACRLAVYLHGAAGDLAAAAESDIAMTAGDIARQIGAACLDLVGPTVTDAP
jgi:NAD(P)H-hydrate epimerase